MCITDEAFFLSSFPSCLPYFLIFFLSSFLPFFPSFFHRLRPTSKTLSHLPSPPVQLLSWLACMCGVWIHFTSLSDLFHAAKHTTPIVFTLAFCWRQKKKLDESWENNQKKKKNHILDAVSSFHPISSLAKTLSTDQQSCLGKGKINRHCPHICALICSLLKLCCANEAPAEPAKTLLAPHLQTEVSVGLGWGGEESSFYFFFLAALRSMQNLSSVTSDGTCAPCRSWVLTTEPPRNP